MKKTICNYLSTYNIHDLRKIARAAGVKSATSCKKDELVEKTCQILLNFEQNPAFSNIGRPPLKAYDDSECLDILAKLRHFASKKMTSDYFCVPNLTVIEHVQMIKKALGTTNDIDVILEVAIALKHQKSTD